MKQALMFADRRGKPSGRPVGAKCHGAPACLRDAIGHVRMRGPGRMWLPVCGHHVGPWTIQGATYVGPVDNRP